jgi:hypothetical protein
MIRILLMAAVLARAGEAAALAEAPPIDDAEEAQAEDAYRFDDPNETRLMLAPTGRPPKKGEGYFSNHELVFPGFGYAFTDHISIAGGISTIPGLGFREQLEYVSPKIGFELSDKVALSVGGLIAGVPGDGYGGAGVALGYGIGTFGTRKASLSLGLGVARELGSNWAVTEPVLMVGAQVRVSKMAALVSESWLVLDGEVPLSAQPFGFAVRLFNQRISADVGFVIVGELIDEGFPIPWLSVTYHFGKRASPSASRARSH